jgi:hypothetical protein
LNLISPLFEIIELLLPWQSPGANKSFPSRITLVQAFTVHGQPYLWSVSWQNNMSPGLVILLLIFGVGFDHKETTETHSDLTDHPSSDKRHITT